jgi:NAD(P)-dependent dehydrogenase (short-subunit alcohol dehydrogenase family)
MTPGAPAVAGERTPFGLRARSEAAAIHKEDRTVSHFEDKVVIVTGGASGIGRALCEELGQRGAKVIVADINVEGAEQVASAITTTGGLARAAPLDVSQVEAVQKLIEETAAEQGWLDFMFNNAGICMVGEVRDMDLEQWRRIVDVNLWGVIHGTTSAYQLMLGQGFGHIINIASADGLMPFPMMTAYSTTKHAVIGLSTGLRAEAAELGVKVSVVPRPDPDRHAGDTNGCYRAQGRGRSPQRLATKLHDDGCGRVRPGHPARRRTQQGHHHCDYLCTYLLVALPAPSSSHQAP